MSEMPDPVEAELLALRPIEVSPGLRRRIAERLAIAPPASPRRPWSLAVAVAAGLAAACLAAVLFRRGDDRPHADPVPIVLPRPPADPPVRTRGPGPTLLACRRAFARSPEALLALLEEDAVATQEPHPELARINAFTRSGAVIHDLLGDD
jgi:hypothetical protein